MKLLLDTRVVLWWLGHGVRASGHGIGRIETRRSRASLSVNIPEDQERPLFLRDHRNPTHCKGEHPGQSLADIRVSIQPIQQFIPRGIKIDCGNPANISVVHGREQEQASIGLHDSPLSSRISD